MPTDYKTVDTSTLRGIEEAERLHAAGWITYRVGLFLIWLYRKRDDAS